MKFLWQRLIKPSATLEDADDQRQARFLAALLVILTGILLATRILLALAGQTPIWNATGWYWDVALVILLAATYALARRGAYRLAARVFIVAGAALLVAQTIQGAESIGARPLYYLPLLLFMGGLFLSRREVLLLGAGQVILLLIGLRVTGAAAAVIRDLLIFTVVADIGLLLLAHRRAKLETEHQQTLDDHAEVAQQMADSAVDEAKLRVSEAHYRRVTELMLDYALAVRIGANGKRETEWIVGNMEEVTGYERDELQETAIERIFHPDEHERIQADLQAVMDGQAAEGVYRMIRKDGQARWVFIRRTPEYDDAQGRVARYHATVRDVTAQKTAESARHASDQQFRLMAETISDVISLHDRDGRYVYVNPAARMVLGYDPDELIGADPYAFIHPDDQTDTQQKHQHLLEKDKSEVVVHRFRAANGRYIWLESHGRPLRDESGHVSGIVISSRDVTERQQDTATLRAREERLERVLQEMPVLLNAFDEGGRFIFWNAECERVTGYPATDVIGNPRATEILYPDEADREAMISQWQQSGSNFRNWELTLTCKDGSRRTIAWSNISAASPIPGWRDWAVGVDVTPLKAAQAKEIELVLHRGREELLKDFIKDVSHDLRNPLSVINTGLYIIQRKLDDNERAKIQDNMNRLERQMMHLTRQLDNMETMLQIYHDDYEYAMRPQNLNEIIQVALDRQEIAIEQKGHHIHVEPATDPLLVNLDSYEFGRALEQILANAVNFTPDNGDITIRTQTAVDRICLYVIDNGIGIDPQDQPHIFEPFYRADPTRSIETGGMGLGLSLVRKILDAHGFTIEIDSAPDRGTAFHIIMPPPSETAHSNGERLYG